MAAPNSERCLFRTSKWSIPDISRIHGNGELCPLLSSIEMNADDDIIISLVTSYPYFISNLNLKIVVDAGTRIFVKNDQKEPGSIIKSDPDNETKIVQLGLKIDKNRDRQWYLLLLLSFFYSCPCYNLTISFKTVIYAPTISSSSMLLTTTLLSKTKKDTISS